MWAMEASLGVLPGHGWLIASPSMWRLERVRASDLPCLVQEVRDASSRQNS
jgi:hypothetical protein